LNDALPGTPQEDFQNAGTRRRQIGSWVKPAEAKQLTPAQETEAKEKVVPTQGPWVDDLAAAILMPQDAMDQFWQISGWAVSLAPALRPEDEWQEYRALHENLAAGLSRLGRRVRLLPRAAPWATLTQAQEPQESKFSRTGAETRADANQTSSAERPKLRAGES
jgi:hypothetical protein